MVVKHLNKDRINSLCVLSYQTSFLSHSSLSLVSPPLTARDVQNNFDPVVKILPETETRAVCSEFALSWEPKKARIVLHQLLPAFSTSLNIYNVHFPKAERVNTENNYKRFQK